VKRSIHKLKVVGAGGVRFTFLFSELCNSMKGFCKKKSNFYAENGKIIYSAKMSQVLKMFGFLSFCVLFSSILWVTSCCCCIGDELMNTKTVFYNTWVKFKFKKAKFLYSKLSFPKSILQIRTNKLSLVMVVWLILATSNFSLLPKLPLKNSTRFKSGK